MAAAVRRNPRDCEARLELSDLLVQHGSLDAAAAHLQKLTADSPDDPRSHFRLAQVRYHQQRSDDAEHAVNAALELDPAHTQALLLRGRLQELRQRDNEALATYYRALAADADQVEAPLRIAEIHIRHGRPQLAAPLLRTVLESHKACAAQQAAANWALGQAYATENRWDDAAQSLTLGSQGRVMNGRDWYQLAYACYQSGNSAGANEALAESLRLAPQDESATALFALLNSAPPAAVVHQAGGTVPPGDARNAVRAN